MNFSFPVKAGRSDVLREGAQVRQSLSSIGKSQLAPELNRKRDNMRHLISPSADSRQLPVSLQDPSGNTSHRLPRI